MLSDSGSHIDLSYQTIKKRSGPANYVDEMDESEYYQPALSILQHEIIDKDTTYNHDFQNQLHINKDAVEAIHLNDISERKEDSASYSNGSSVYNIQYSSSVDEVAIRETSFNRNPVMTCEYIRLYYNLDTLCHSGCSGDECNRIISSSVVSSILSYSQIKRYIVSRCRV